MYTWQVKNEHGDEFNENVAAKPKAATIEEAIDRALAFINQSWEKRVMCQGHIVINIFNLNGGLAHTETKVMPQVNTPKE